MPKHCLTHIFIVAIFISCKTKQHVFVFPSETQNISSALYVNNDVDKFNKLENRIVRKAESETSYNNPITLHFKKHISKRDLEQVEFSEWRKNVYLEFTVDNNHELLDLHTNSKSKKLDSKLKKVFEDFNLKLVTHNKFNPLYRYTVVIIQNINNKAVIKCNSKAIGYIPPIFSDCGKTNSYKALNRCNYLYITEYLYNHVDISLVDEMDIENNHQIYPKLIIDKKGNIVAAKVESQNKQFLESYYQAIMSMPKATQPAMFNEINEYYGYNLPTSITNIINNNSDFKAYYDNVTVDYVNAKKMMKHYVQQLHYNKLASHKHQINYK
ncbi:hypothetical protein ACXGQW_03835 [Wenyingzhuangia sp. IMCC45533]